MNLDTILDALVGVLDNSPDINVTARPPSVLEPPAAFVSDVLAEPHQEFEGAWDITVEVVYLLSLGDLDHAWDLGNDLMSSATTNSILNNLVGSPTLGGAVQSSHLLRLHGPSWHKYADVDYWGIEVTVSLFAE